MRYLLAYHRRLGDIVQLLPACLHLSRQGHAVFLECDPLYHDIFECVDYVRPVAPGEPRDGYDRVLELAIHPDGGGTAARFQQFRASGRRWADFVYDVPDIRGSYARPVFTDIGHCRPCDYGLPDDGDYLLIAPIGYSQQIVYDPADLVAWCAQRWPGKRIFGLVDDQTAAFPPFVCARRLRDLPAIVSWPRYFASINTSTALIAAGVRQQYVHFPQTGRAAQDDTAFPEVSEVVVPRRNASLGSPVAKDLTQIAEDSEFAMSISALFQQIRPRRIIETGTYLGIGSTRVIAEAMLQFGAPDAVFVSIEINPSHYAQARRNLGQLGLLQHVGLELGVSVPRDLLPTMDEIRERTASSQHRPDIYIDHAEAVRAERYFAETNFAEGPDDLLGTTIATFDGRPDFVLLDSGGHMGLVEFNHLVASLRHPCYIGLDDVRHIKHHKSLEFMRGDARFDILHESAEKFGFCIARFDPAAGGVMTGSEPRACESVGDQASLAVLRG